VAEMNRLFQIRHTGEEGLSFGHGIITQCDCGRKGWRMVVNRETGG
jgi:hypothetical protein